MRKTSEQRAYNSRLIKYRTGGFSSRGRQQGIILSAMFHQAGYPMDQARAPIHKTTVRDQRTKQDHKQEG